MKNEYLIYTEDKSIITVNHPKLPEFRMIKIEGGEGIIEELDNKKTKVADFYMAEYQVTQELYQAVIGENPSHFKGKRRPVERVNWYDSVEFCRKLNELLELPQPIKGSDNGQGALGKAFTWLLELPQPIKGSDDKAKLDLTKQGFRLPTEAEWEYAARGDVVVEPQGFVALQQQYKYAGTNYLHQVGWYDVNNNFETRPVGLKFPNALSLYDMNGNVWEWCWDWYNNDNRAHVLRGGSWFNNAGFSRVASRYYFTPGDRNNNRGGFRLALSSSL